MEPKRTKLLQEHLEQLNTWDTFHLSELTGQAIPIAMKILLLIETTQPDQLNPIYM